MGAPNFKQQEHDFPMYVISDAMFTYEDDDGDAQFDQWMFDDFIEDFQPRIDELNSDLEFFQVSLEPGYYAGMQIYIEPKHFDLEEDDFDNNDTQYYFALNRSTAIRKYRSERTKLKRTLKKLAKEHNLKAYAVAYRFSNGETGYCEVTT